MVRPPALAKRLRGYWQNLTFSTRCDDGIRIGLPHKFISRSVSAGISNNKSFKEGLWAAMQMLIKPNPTALKTDYANTSVDSA